MHAHHDHAFPAEVLSVNEKCDSSKKRGPPSSSLSPSPSLSPSLLHVWLTFSEHSTNLENSTPLSHISDQAAYRLLKNALTPPPSRATDTAQDIEQKQARADIGNIAVVRLQAYCARSHDL